MRWISTSQSHFSESFFWSLSEEIFFVTIGFKALPNILLQVPWTQCYQTAQWKEWCNSVRWTHTSQSSFSGSFSLFFIWRYFLFHHRPQCAPKYPFADSMKTVLANCSMKRTVKLCKLNPHIIQQFLRKLLSSFCLRIFPLAPMSSEITYCKFQANSVSKLLTERNGVTL